MKNKKQNLTGKIATSFLTALFTIYYFLSFVSAGALTPTATASPSAITTPGEKVQELREIIKDQAKNDINEILEKIENKAYVGIITEITDQTITINNFRGKQRVRLDETTKIIGTNKKEIKSEDLAVEDKIIALGGTDENKTLEAKRVSIITPPKIIPPKRVVFLGTITEIDLKNSTLTAVENKTDGQTLTFSIGKNTFLSDQEDQKKSMFLKDYSEGKKIIVIYPASPETKSPVAKSIFILSR